MKNRSHWAGFSFCDPKLGQHGRRMCRVGRSSAHEELNGVNDPGPFEFGQLLRRLRLSANLTQELLAERAGVSTGAITSYERGNRSRPYQQTVVLLADALGLTNAARAEFEAAAQRRRGVRKESKGLATILPLRTTSFVGRRRELDDVRPLLARERLLTLAGIGGSGKTSLAIEAVRAQPNGLPGEVYFVELANSTDSVASIVARAMAVAEPSGAAADASLADALRDRSGLLVLDNCEHVMRACAPVITCGPSATSPACGS
jgi:transcriptional regulator with XRE-family HTH domain